MPNASIKMKLRAKLINMLSKYRTDKNPSNESIMKDIAALCEIEDKAYVGKLLFKEIGSNEMGPYVNICAIMAIEVLDKNLFENCAINFLQDNKNSDTKKFFIISLIKQKGIYFDYNQIDEYISNPEETTNKSIEGFLENFSEDPEVQMDVLDFYLNIPKSERFYFLENISKNSDDALLSQVCSIVLRLNVEQDEFKILTNLILESDSPYATEGINYILENYKIDLKLRQKLQNKVKKLKENYKDFINLDIVKKSSINSCYISFIDGNSNFSLILSRKADNQLIDAVFLTININYGIVACMGFGGITTTSYRTILARLFPDSLPAKISAMALKALYGCYKNKNKKSKVPLPYELIVWEKLFNDIKDINYDVPDFINSKLDSINLTKEKVKKFANSKVTETWFWTYGQNDLINEIFKEIDEKHIIKYGEIKKTISDFTDKNLINNEEFIKEIKERLLLQAYVANLAKLKMSSAVAYSLCFKNPYFKMFIETLIEKSIYEYFSNQVKIAEKDNIFRKKNKSNYTTKELESLMAQIEAKWI